MYIEKPAVGTKRIYQLIPSYNTNESQQELFHHYRALTFNNAIDNVEFTVASISLKQVLTPSATGVTITSTAGGTTYNWASIESGFDYNDAKGYTYKLTAPATGGFGFGFVS